MEDFLVTLRVKQPNGIGQAERADYLKREGDVFKAMFASGEIQTLYHPGTPLRPTATA